MSTLAFNEIEERLKVLDETRITITSILDLEEQINKIGIDCRLSKIPF